ncbi:putative PEP-binding protein, partial [Treponema porcinum]|uniref:putative PEP-binding protein n=1 Tax=Treponema porcinum TaxID=261392 RepID=UPI0023F3023E
SHAAVVARGMGKCCVSGAGALVIDYKKRTVTIEGNVLHEGDYISINGSTGDVYKGELTTQAAEFSGAFAELMQLCDKYTRLVVRTNADTPHDASVARKFGAVGIGLCRTEHMFFDEPKLTAFQKMIVSETTEARKENLKAILPLQQKDFYEIIKAMEGRPVTIRLLDPPLNEFIQAEDAKALKALAKKLGIKADVLAQKVAALDEHNPMLGHRGCRLAITYPEIYETQVEAIARATAQLDKEGIKHDVRIMIPNVVTYREVEQIRAQAEDVIATVNKELGTSLTFQIGSMVEFPRTALSADKVAQYADFFSFGSNDLTQTTLGFSRDDYGKFIQSYLDQRILEDDPFATLDADGPGALMEIAEAKGRSVKADLHLGICGEHGGDPASIALCYKYGLNYVSCSPFRVPLARLAGAQAVIKTSK